MKDDDDGTGGPSAAGEAPDDRDRLQDHVVEEVVDEPGSGPRQEVSSDEDDPDREGEDRFDAG